MPNVACRRTVLSRPSLVYPIDCQSRLAVAAIDGQLLPRNRMMGVFALLPRQHSLETLHPRAVSCSYAQAYPSTGEGVKFDEDLVGGQT